jgi:hypothetical protein
VFWRHTQFIIVDKTLLKRNAARTGSPNSASTNECFVLFGKLKKKKKKQQQQHKNKTKKAAITGIKRGPVSLSPKLNTVQ